MPRLIPIGLIPLRAGLGDPCCSLPQNTLGLQFLKCQISILPIDLYFQGTRILLYSNATKVNETKSEIPF